MRQGGRSPYSFGNVSNPANGIVEGTAPNLTYTPNLGFSGSDIFTFDVTDANGATATGSVSIEVDGPLMTFGDQYSVYQGYVTEYYFEGFWWCIAVHIPDSGWGQ